MVSESDFNKQIQFQAYFFNDEGKRATTSPFLYPANWLVDIQDEVNTITHSDLPSLTSQLMNHQDTLNEVFHRLATIDNSVNNRITECRLLFRETEGSAACQGTRNSTTNWVGVNQDGGWTAPFRDDTDDRGGGCTYQWKLECR